MNPWIRYPRPSPGGGLRVFCLPAAGGGVASFRSWTAIGHPGLELAVIRLPGREARAREAPLHDLPALVDGLLDALHAETNVPYAIFGHSTGALIAFELARRLESAGQRPPLAVFVSAQHPPHLPPPPSVASLPTPELLAFLGALGGTSARALTDPQMLEMVLPAIRADFALAESYRYVPGTRLRRPIRALAGAEDAYVPREAMERWRDLTAADSTLRVLPGEHFFVTACAREIIEAIVLDCADLAT